MKFEKYPFEKLNELLDGIVPNDNFEASVLTIGEPKFNTPNNILEALKDNANLLNKYPKSAGEEELYEAISYFIKKRFNIILSKDELIPTFGTREVLFNFPQFFLFEKNNPTISFTNPFYQIYEGSAIASRAKIIYINLNKNNNFEAMLDEKQLKEVDLVILNYPNNPTAKNISFDKLKWWVEQAVRFDFCLINDECYSEIYFDKKPKSLLEACRAVGNDSFKNCLVLNSISKRNSAPGLRSGFIAGDKNILKEYKRYRTYIGCAVPLPLQKASCIAWRDFKSSEEFRLKYKQNMLLAKDILGIDIPEATFYIWLEVDDDLEFTKRLYKEKNIKVLPGRFLGREDEGKNFVRIALVEEPTKTKEVLKRLKSFLDK